MILGPDELTELCYALGLTRKWANFPTLQTLRAIRQEALELDDGSGNPRVEAASLLYAAGRDEKRLGDAKEELPILIARDHMRNHRLNLSARDINALLDLLDEIAAGEADWPRVKQWFERRLFQVD